MIDDSADTPETEEAPRPTAVQAGNETSIYVDWTFGVAVGGGNLRVLMGEIIFNQDPEATIPNVRPTINLVMPEAAARALISILQANLDSIDASRND